jgi:hypothetical protein
MEDEFDGENLWSFREIGADLRPELRPAVLGGAEEGKAFRLGPGVPEAEVFLIDTSAEGKPFFRTARGFNDVHAGNDSDGGMRSQMRGRRFARRHRVTNKISDRSLPSLTFSVALWGTSLHG